MTPAGRGADRSLELVRQSLLQGDDLPFQAALTVVERCGQPIRLDLPYLGETQVAKQYRVVMDRGRWFSVVVGESFRIDARSTERLADRVPLPEALARAFAFRREATDGVASAELME